jgi:mercuric reductase
MDRQFDLVILGSGSTAFAAALPAEEMGESAVRGEEPPIGGRTIRFVSVGYAGHGREDGGS